MKNGLARGRARCSMSRGKGFAVILGETQMGWNPVGEKWTDQKGRDMVEQLNLVTAWIRGMGKLEIKAPFAERGNAGGTADLSVSEVWGVDSR